VKKILSREVTHSDITAALNRIADVADPDDVQLIRAELAFLQRILDAGDDEDVDFRPWSLAGASQIVGVTSGTFPRFELTGEAG
jgi:hypothetical protein